MSSKKLKRKKYLNYQLNWVNLEIETLSTKSLPKEELQKAKNHYYSLRREFLEELETLEQE